MLNVIVATVLFILTPSAVGQTQTRGLFETQFPGIDLRVVPGDIVSQNTQAIILSHWPYIVNDGGIGEEIAHAGGQSAIEQFDDIMRASAEPLFYTSVHATPLRTDARIQAQTLLNVIELKPMNHLYFLTPEELEKSGFPISAEDRETYKDLLTEYGSVLNDYRHRLNGVKALYNKTKSNSDYTEILNVIWEGPSHVFELRRNAILKKYEKPLNFEIVVFSVLHALQKAQKLKIRSVSLAAMPRGFGEHLDMPESIAAIAMGTKLFSITQTPVVRELRIVIYDVNTLEKWAHVNNEVYSVFREDNFMRSAESYGFNLNNLDREAKRLDHLTDTPLSSQGLIQRSMRPLMTSCEKILKFYRR